MPIFAVRLERSETAFMTVEAPNWEAAHSLAFEFVEVTKATYDEWTASIKELEGTEAALTKAMAMDDDSYYSIGSDGSYGGSYVPPSDTGDEELPF